MKKYICLLLIILFPVSTFAITKTETIYTYIDTNGKILKSTVNNKISNLDKTTYEDYTLLNKITNINGNEKFTLNDNKLTWESKGKDIYYQAPNTLEQPIIIKTKYYLNNELIDVKKLNNKKGNIKIEINLENNSYNDKYNMYNPFVVAIGTTLNNKYNKNITITNGEVIDNGKTTALAAIASPGLYSNIKIDELKNLDHIIITYETTKFEQKEIYAVATPKLLDKIDISRLSKLDNLSSSLNLLQENMNKIENGSKSLTEGTEKIKNGSNAITNNLGIVVDGVNDLKSGSNKLDYALNQIITELNNQINEMSSQEISFAEIEQLIAGDEQAITKLTAANETFKQTLAKDGLDITKSNQELSNELLVLVQSGIINQETMTSIMTYKSLYDGNNESIYLYKLNINALNTMKDKLIQASTKITSLANTLTATLQQVEQGASQIDNGLLNLGTGLDKLYAGAQELSNGTNELNNGANTLSEGIKKFNNDGIKKLTNYSSIINNYSNKVKVLSSMSNDYKGYSTNNADKTIFIYKIK